MKINLRQNVSLAELTTLRIGGKARFFLSAESEIEIIEALNFAEENDLPVFIFGGGSNVLIADEGFAGLVLRINLKGIAITENQNEIIQIEAKAGEDWDAFCAFCVGEDLQGIECLSGIPGLVGGTPVQNVGAYGQEVSETIVKVRCFDRKNKTIVELSKAECGFAYRTSIFNTTQKNGFVVLSVTYALKKNAAPKIIYKDLQKYFGDRKPNLAETRRAVLHIRAAKSMVIAANDPNSKSVGSFFKNPIVSNDKLASVEKTVNKIGIETIPKFSFDAENVKIPAAWLIENSGFYKGFKYNRVGLSENHALAVINRGGATANDVVRLKNLIQEKVFEKFQIKLEPEPIFVGFDLTV